jgi:DNA processing protein
VAIVGTRRMSKYGEKITRIFSSELSKNGICIVSGLAKGIDTIAHENSCNNEGKTIAVLGSGFNHIYPKENNSLYKKIVEDGGLVISEYSPETSPEAQNFPKRNRIISGLSFGTIVVEAPLRSGALITADLALEQGKEVYCVPGNIDSFRSAGTNLLIKQGAKPAISFKDVLEDVAFT